MPKTTSTWPRLKAASECCLLLLLLLVIPAPIEQFFNCFQRHFKVAIKLKKILAGKTKLKDEVVARLKF